MAYGDFKDLTRRTASDKILRGKAFNISKMLPSMIYIFFDKNGSATCAWSETSTTQTMRNKFTDSSISIKNENILSEELAEELCKPTKRKFKKRKVHSSFTQNIWGADLADMQLISTFNKEILFFYYSLIFLSKYTWIIPLKDKKGAIITNFFKKILDQTYHKRSKIWVDKGGEYCNRSMKPFLQNNIIKMYSTRNEVKSVVAESLLEPERIKFINTCLQYQKKCVY